MSQFEDCVPFCKAASALNDMFFLSFSRFFFYFSSHAFNQENASLLLAGAIPVPHKAHRARVALAQTDDLLALFKEEMCAMPCRRNALFALMATNQTKLSLQMEYVHANSMDTQNGFHACTQLSHFPFSSLITSIYLIVASS